MQRRRLALLALLATAPTRAMSREKLATFLFPDCRGEKAHHALADAVHSLRKTIGRDALETIGESLHLKEDLLACDVVEFENHLAAGNVAAAIALYTGPFLDGFFVPEAAELDQHFDMQRARLQALWTRAAEEAAVQCEAGQDWAGAVALWQKLSAVDPFSTRFALALMRALSESGNRAAAIRHAGVHEALLREDLGIDAAPDVRSLAEALRTGQEPRRQQAEAAPGSVVSDAVALPDRIAKAPRRRRIIATTAVVVVAVGGFAGAMLLRPARTALPAPSRDTAGLDALSERQYLRARYHMTRVTGESMDSAVALLTSVVQRSPNFAEGHAQLALTYMYQFSTFRGGNEELEKKAWVESEVALKLNPNSANVHLVRGRILWTPTNGFAHEQAAAEYRRALAIDPNNLDAHLQLGQVLAHVGLMQAGLDELNKADRLNPADARARLSIGMVDYWMGDASGALEQLRTVPSSVNRAQTGAHLVLSLLRLGRGAEAESRLAEFLAGGADDAGVLTSTRAVLWAHRGNAAEAHSAIAKALDARSESILYHHALYNVAVTYALLGQRDSAMLWLQRTADEGFPCYPLFERDPDLANVRGLPAFAAFMRDVRSRYENYKRALD